MHLFCDNKLAINTTLNPVQHHKTKYIKIDKYFIKEKFKSKLLCMSYISTNYQRADMLTKGVSNTTFQTLIIKLKIDNIYSSD